jgi:hypothetical protein
MAYELIRTIIQKVLQDKILMGLVVICVLGLFVGGMTMNDEKGEKKEKSETAATAEQGQPAQQQAATPAAGLTPSIATDFVSWWLQAAMDYNGASAAQNHQSAMQWMTPEAAQAFQNLFWNPQIAESVATGRLVAAFHPTNVQAQAVNPDGSVVVAVTGTMVVQTGAQPTAQQFAGAFLVRKDNDSLRVAGLEAQSVGLPGSAVY